MTEASSFENFMFMNGGENPYGEEPSDSEEPAEADMAQMMGFSNFGSKPKPQSKKRKREIAQLAASGPGAESGSGSNTMPLGIPRRRQMEAKDRLDGRSEQDVVSSRKEISRDEGVGGLQQSSGQAGRVVPQTLPEERATLQAYSTQQTPSASGSLQPQHDWQALRKGVRDSRGDIIYYNTSFVEDPWKDLG